MKPALSNTGWQSYKAQEAGPSQGPLSSAWQFVTTPCPPPPPPTPRPMSRAGLREQPGAHSPPRPTAPSGPAALTPPPTHWQHLFNHHWRPFSSEWIPQLLRSRKRGVTSRPRVAPDSFSRGTPAAPRPAHKPAALAWTRAPPRRGTGAHPGPSRTSRAEDSPQTCPDATQPSPPRILAPRPRGHPRQGPWRLQGCGGQIPSNSAGTSGGDAKQLLLRLPPLPPAFQRPKLPPTSPGTDECGRS